MNAKRAAWLTAGILVASAIFHFTVVLGAPFGRFTQGGQTDGALAATGRAVAAVSMVILVAMSAVVLALVGDGPMRRLPRRRARTLGWCVVAWMAIGTAMNIASPSALERPWAIATVIALAGTLRVLREPGRVSEG